jgi:hypothetical protein
VDRPPDGVGQPEGGEAPSLDDDEELQESGPRRDEGSQHLRRQAAGSRDHSCCKGCHLLWHRGVRNRGRGPRTASASRSARSILPAGWGASITATSGDSAFRAPPGAGPRRVRAMVVPGAARFSAPCIGASMRRGPLIPGAQRAGTFGLFLLPGGRPCHFAPELEDSAAAEEAEGSMAWGRCLGRK